MECEKCGAGVNEGAETCPECGEPLAANAAETAPEEMAAAAAATPEGMVVGTDTLEPSPVTSTSSEPSGGPRPAIIGAIALVVVVVLAGAWFLMNAQGGNTPAGAVKAMLTAYANYDGAGILAVSTHSTLKPADITTFERSAADAKVTAGGKPGVRAVVIGTATTSDTTASVDVTAEWLANEKTGTYQKRTQTLPLIKQNGKWLVQLF